MNWTELLKSQIDETYHAADGLLSQVDDTMLSWKPSTGSNWMTVGQLLRHMTDACGMCCKGFVTGHWPMPEGATPEEMLPKAEKMPAVKSVAEARKLLEEDKRLAYEMVDKAGEKDLASKLVEAPWSPGVKAPLGRRLLDMVFHLNQHKGQLFYYVKLMGKPVHTGHMYGM